MVMYWVAVPALVVERRGILESFGRSEELTAGRRWKVLWVSVGAMLLSFVLSTVIGIVFHILTQVTSGGTELVVRRWILIETQSPVARSLQWVLFAGIFTAVSAASFVELRSLATTQGDSR